jgi:hypothetical protein
VARNDDALALQDAVDKLGQRFFASVTLCVPMGINIAMLRLFCRGGRNSEGGRISEVP